MKSSTLLFYISIATIISCKNEVINSQSKDNGEFKSYWYAGDAEISSYSLKQARYGEIREGEAVMIFVTEHFSKNNFTKTDNVKNGDIPVLKMNFTKRFNTGIYPYSMMNSTFYPIDKGNHSLKISSSSQEWCGHTYMELLQKSNFDVSIRSYFEGENMQNVSLPKAILEDDIWSMIRINPELLPQGKFTAYPAFFYIRLLHKEMKAYKCEGKLIDEATTKAYTITYPDLGRTLNIHFEKEFPYKIVSWQESYTDGFQDKKMLTTSGELIKQIKSPYWTQNKKEFEYLRDTLGLKF